MRNIVDLVVFPRKVRYECIFRVYSNELNIDGDIPHCVSLETESTLEVVQRRMHFNM